MSENKRGGPGRGQGRKPVAQGEETVTVSLRVTVAQREKLARLGGAKWVRSAIEQEGGSCDAICDAAGSNDDISTPQSGHNKAASI